MRKIGFFAALLVGVLGVSNTFGQVAVGPVFSDDAAGRAAHQQFLEWDAQRTQNSFRFFNNPRWQNTVTNGGGLGQGDPTTLTWSVVPDGTFIRSGVGEPAGNSDLISFLDGVYHGGTSPGGADLTQRTWWAEMDQSFQRFSDLSGLDYIYEANDDGIAHVDNAGVANVRGDVRIAGKLIDGNSGTLAYNFGPNSGDMVIDTRDNFYNGNSLRFRNVFMHEHGHGIGQAHTDPVNNTKLMEPFINLGFDGPQFDDILGMQRQYGDVHEKAGGNDTAGTATALGNVADGGSVEIGADAVGLTSSLLNSPTDVDFISIDDNSDLDFISFNAIGNGTVDLTLTPVGPTYSEGPQNGATSNLNTQALSDLTLTLIDQDGTTILGTANANGLGGIEQLLGQAVTVGTYFARISGTADNVQMYHFEVAAVYNVPEPGAIGVLALLGIGLAGRRRKRA